MKFVNIYGGHPIGIYALATRNKIKAHRILRDDRIKYFPADYSEGSDLNSILKAIIENTHINERLERVYFSKKKEVV